MVNILSTVGLLIGSGATFRRSVIKMSKLTALGEVNNGAFVRTAAAFRNIISSENATYKPEFNRYHLYISLACPWANRCYAALKMKGLEKCIGVSIVHPTWQHTRPNDPSDGHSGWVFNTGSLSSPTGMGKFLVKNCTTDPINNALTIRDIYNLSDGGVSTKFSVPVLWDKKTNTIVNNESSEIVRMFTSAFDQWAEGAYATYDLYPEPLRAKIDEVNDWVYPGINNGVYRCGFAQSQAAYDEAVTQLYGALDRLEAILQKQRYVVGNTYTEADLRLFMTLVRFDEVYVVYFKCNVRRIADYPCIRQYCRDLYQSFNIGQAIDMDHIKTHYFT